jgi:hypothetical protein
MKECAKLIFVVALSASASIRCGSPASHQTTSQPPPGTPTTSAPTTPATHAADRATEAADKIIADVRQRQRQADEAQKKWKDEHSKPEVVISYSAPPPRPVIQPSTASQSASRLPPTATEQMEATAEKVFGPRMAEIAEQLSQAQREFSATYRQASAACAGVTAGTSSGLIFDPFSDGTHGGMDVLATTSSIELDNSTSPLCRVLKTQATDLMATKAALSGRNYKTWRRQPTEWASIQVCYDGCGRGSTFVGLREPVAMALSVSVGHCEARYKTSNDSRNYLRES